MQYTNEANMYSDRITKTFQLVEAKEYGILIDESKGWEFVGMMTDNEFIIEALGKFSPVFYMLMRYEKGQSGDGYFVETIADIYEPFCLQMEIDGKLYNVLKSMYINLSL